MSDDLDVRWGLAKRFEFIEWRAYWTGRINRKDLEEQFHISTPQASQDFQDYLKLAPNNITYDGTLKTYIATDKFKPKFFSLQSAERYLRQLQALKVNAIELADTWFGEVPPADVIPPITRSPQPYALQPILQAIRDRKSLAIDYVSLQSHGIRNICPHALAHDGYRWHVRALSIERQEYRDYVLARIISVSTRADDVTADPADDIAWQTLIKLRLVAHPGLNVGQRAAIEHDYRMQEGKLEIETRVALASYFIRRHNLDLRDHPDLSPQRAQISLQNLDEVNEAIAKADKESKLLIKQRSTLTERIGGRATPN